MIVTVPVFVPAFGYTFDTELLLPIKESVPLQEYVYEPLAPVALADQFNNPPIFTLEGFTEQEPVKPTGVGGGGVGLVQKLLVGKPCPHHLKQKPKKE